MPDTPDRSKQHRSGTTDSRADSGCNSRPGADPLAAGAADPRSPDGRANPRPTGERALDARVADGPDEYRFATADGVAPPDAFRDAELLLAEALWERSPGRLLVPEANDGVVGTVLAPRADAVHMTESSARAAALAARNADRNGADATVSVVAECAALGERFDAVAYAPRAYTPLAMGKRRIANALSTLRPGGALFVAAGKRAGLSRYEDCLVELAADVTTVERRDGCHLLEATRPPRVDLPGYVTPRRLTPTVDGVDLSLWSVPGLFSPGELDAGTRLLLETATVEDGDRVLDLCCGYGPVGTYAARAADSEVVLADDDAVATACARRSLDASGVDGAVVTGDATTAVVGRFDRVLSNPPTHAGSEVLAALCDGAADALAPGGRFTLVHHRDLDLSAHLSAFGTVERRATGAEHVVLTART